MIETSPSFPNLRADRPWVEDLETVLTPEACALVEQLTRRFRRQLAELMTCRLRSQQRYDAGELPSFAAETRAIRDDDWQAAPAPPDLRDRRVEITGPVDRKMIINGLNSGASVFMADFEDATSPTWSNIVCGQRHLIDAVRRTIAHRDAGSQKTYELAPRPAVLIVRPRGLHLPEWNFVVDGEPAPAALFDAGLFLFHNAAALLALGTGPYLYLPKLQSAAEAKFWNDVLREAEAVLRLPPASVRVTVLIETLPAAFQMHEIIYELRERVTGLNCGRWDYIFSAIKTRRADPRFLLPNRTQVTMETTFLRSYAGLLVQTCHRRGIHAMGGMSAYIPIRNDSRATEAALDEVRHDKLREVQLGHDGTWVAHPGLVGLARQIFDDHMPGPNQINRPADTTCITAEQLLHTPGGNRTERGLRDNLRVCLRYLESWLRGTGCVPLDGLMEDAATAEICRSQIAQWVHHGALLEDSRPVTSALVRALTVLELDRIRRDIGTLDFEGGCYDVASEILDELITAKPLPDFLTLPAYRRLVSDRRVRQGWQ
jgi:malate synthase